MERLRQLISEIAARLSVLTVSQRLAIGLCTVLAAFSMLWLMQWSTLPDTVSLLNHDFSYSELDGAEEALKANDIPYEIRGTRVFVGPADRHNALRVLHAANALPEGSLYDMASVVSDQNPFAAPEARDYAQNYAKGNELAKIIATTQSVKQASVIINPKSKRRLGGQSDVPTASVAVMLASGQELSEQMVDGFAKLVSGAVAGLKPHNVYVTDTNTGRSYNTPHPDDLASFDVFSMEKKREAHLQSKILGALAYIPGLRVAVTVEVDSSKRTMQKLRHEAAQPRIETAQSSEQGGSSPAAEPGVQANLGQAVSGGAGASTSTTEQSSVENFEPKLAETETVEQVPFAPKSVTAAIGIPRSFIVGIFKARYPEKSDPKDEDGEFTGIMEDQIAKVRAGVERIVMAKDPKNVQVNVYPDVEWSASGSSLSQLPGVATVVEARTESIDAMDMARDYGPQLGLATLALVSMFMMMRIVRSVPKPPPLPEVETAKAAGSKPSSEGADEEQEQLLVAGTSPVGKAATSETLLIAREIDDQTLRFQQLGEEVSKLVESDPEGAAGLIRRWLDND